MGRMRSPNYPILPLEDAINAARTVWDKNRKALISREAGVKDLGYSGLTGRSMQVLGALNQYGLTETSVKGQMRVTQVAEDIFVGYPESVKRAAITKAGHTPTLFRDIYERFDGIAPGDNALRSYLFQRGFTNDGVERALKTFNDTNRYVEVFGDAESSAPVAPSIAESAPEPDWGIGAMQPASNVQVVEPKGGTPFFSSGPLDFSLTSSGLAVSGRTNSQTELKAFVEKLNALAGLLPEPHGEEI